MSSFLFEHEPALRIGAFVGVLGAMMVWEGWAPRRARALPRVRRWPSNLGIVALNTALVRVLFPVAAVGVAAIGERRGFGLLQQLAGPAWAKAIAAVLVLDLAIYLQHVMFHAVPLFWRLHRMHHADLDLDATSGVRFHPLEIVLSMGLKCAVVAALGAPAAAVLGFEVLLNATAMFSHGNVRLPLRLDRALRWIVVTPDMHRVHHSVIPDETNRNFGFNLSCWDRWLGTYRAQPAAGHEAMTIGLQMFRNPREQRLDRMLLQPLAPLQGEAGSAGRATNR
jgi:sterol desaturase/sphingolipid hydroxylase (fatty acid hydroxylase superfamily)